MKTEMLIKRLFLLAVLFLISYFYYGDKMSTEVQAETDPYAGFNVYFGDMHVHSNLSDGKEKPEFGYEWAKTQTKLDFAAISDHAEMLANYPGDWDYLKQIASNYNTSDLVTFVGFEWSANNPDGHKNIYFSDNNGILVSSNRNKLTPPQPDSLLEARDAPALFTTLAANNVSTDLGYIIIPHHTVTKRCPIQGYEKIVYQTDWTHSDPKQRLVEIFSKWGSNEHKNLPLVRPCDCYCGYYCPTTTNPIFPAGCEASALVSVMDALSMGQVLGFTGGSDTHLTKPGDITTDETSAATGSVEDGIVDPWGGITGVYAKYKTRNSIFWALSNRRTYATTGKKIKLKFSSGVHMMGEKFQTAEKPMFTISAFPDGAPRIKKVEIIKGVIGAPRPFPVVAELCNNVEICETTWQDINFTANSFYYMRLTQEKIPGDFNEHMAWSSPIWIEKIEVTLTPTTTPTPTLQIVKGINKYNSEAPLIDNFFNNCQSVSVKNKKWQTMVNNFLMADFPLSGRWDFYIQCR